MRCVRLLLVGSLIVGLFGAAPVAAQDEFDEGFDFGPTPEAWDPEVNPDVRPAGFMAAGVTYNIVTGETYDPQIGVIAEDGSVTDPFTGEFLFQDPFLADLLLTPEEYNQFVAQDIAPKWGPLDGTPEGLETYFRALPSDRPAGGPDVVEPGGQTNADQADVTDPVEPAPGADADGVLEGEPTNPQAFADLIAEDPVLALYGTDFTAEDLAPFAFDTSAFPEGAIDDAFQFTAYEIALLFEMGAFARNTPWYDTFADIHRQFDLGDTQDLDLVQTFAAVDQEFARRTTLYQNALDPQTDFFVGWGVTTLDSAFYDQLAAGNWGFLIGFEYAAGLMRIIATGANTDLVSTGNAQIIQLQTALEATIDQLEIQQDLNTLLRADIDDLRNQVALLSRPTMRSAILPLDGVDVPGGPEGDDGDLVLYSAIAGLGGLLVLGAIFFLLRQRRADKRAPDPLRYDQDAAMATNQLLAGARDEDEIVRILDRASETQVGHTTVLFHAVSDGLQPVGSKTILTGSDLNRVVTSGQRAMTVLRNDPAFPGETHAVMALPVIHGGKVQAVLAAHRPGEQPFTDADRARLEPIAPALGGALETASELGTLTKLAMVDGLTSLGNRRRLDGDLETTLASAVAGDAPLGFAMIDVDHFKTYNDTHGHAAGDEVLRKVAATIERCVRESDVVYRYGGEEFSILFPGASPEEAAQVAERVRATVEAEPFPGEERQPGGSLTISVGVATLATGGADDIRERADQALYQAKHNGRNRVAYA